MEDCYTIYYPVQRKYIGFFKNDELVFKFAEWLFNNYLINRVNLEFMVNEEEVFVRDYLYVQDHTETLPLSENNYSSSYDYCGHFNAAILM